jgi:hypothetical protein
VSVLKSIRNGFVIAAAMMLAIPVSAQGGVSDTVVKVPGPIPALGTPAYSALIETLGGKMLDGIRAGYRNCMSDELGAYIYKQKLTRETFRKHVAELGADGRARLSDRIITGCRPSKDRLLTEMETDVVAKSSVPRAVGQFMAIARNEFDTMDEELRTNLHNIAANIEKP